MAHKLACLGAALGLVVPADAFLPSQFARQAPKVVARQRPVVSMSETLAKTDKRGFPEGDPRAKGGDENDVGLQVGPMMWRWPSNWPYPDGFHSVKANTTGAIDWYAANAAAAASKTGPFIDAVAQANLDQHMERHVAKDADILDLGAGAQTALPKGFATKSLVGIGASASEMDMNGRLQEKIVLDLNTVNDENPLPFADQSKDVVLLSFSAEFLEDPKAVFKEIYRVLRVGGSCHVVFTSKNTYKGYEDKQVSFWGDMNDAQHMYVVGSYFQFSAGGWSQLKGYDITDEKTKNSNRFLNMGVGDSKSANLFVVSSTRAAKPGAEAGPLRHMQAELWETPFMQPDDRRLCAERIHAMYQLAETSEDKDRYFNSIYRLNEIYDILKVMNKVLPAPIMALFAANLAPNWTNSDAEKEALREGLGLINPRDEFWKPLGAATTNLQAEDKIWLLVDLIPYFAPGNEKGKAVLLTLPAVMEDVASVLKEKAPDLDDGDIQLLASDLALTEFLFIEDEDERAKFGPWLKDTVTNIDVNAMLKNRKGYKDVLGTRNTISVADAKKAAGISPTA
mmetsp:Transcript_33758/g.77914  ORF Transcript_33758/g.77914 Transcript_33758/m.77914 type:complete len:566 (+) Transcript_33758:119-1816(+)|eukprot:CAMPEP_0182569982 /NCGR_PEP_ID=MMETSP1324-20130603/10439_1 /TAXON_ID=236786 /ORGANISM="Florenciella sp., Strain RCC1587" /LENGTH=565 /DNA_ID=CAMNT_0024784317 /DNA_START=117 /DNA_END=1814 /DNA_ORIENTATION=+